MLRASLSRFLILSSNYCSRQIIRHSTNSVVLGKDKYSNNQIEYIKSALNDNVEDWKSLKSQVLNIKGSFNEINIDGVLLKLMLNHKKYDAAISFSKYLKSSEKELSLGVINGLLGLYYQLGLERKLTDEETRFILDSYEKLYEKYEVLDSTTSERLLHALCVIGEWKKALKVIEEIHLSCNPTHSAYSTIIATLFNLNKRAEALRIVEKSIRNRRPLIHVAYEAWVKYILRKYKEKKTIINYLDEICEHISRNFAVVPEKTAELLTETYTSLGWNVRQTRIRKQSGQCVYCKSSLECLKISEEEFQLLQKTVKEKIIVGSDILLKTNPEELKRFTQFVEETAPYDVVLDALNISYSAANRNIDKVLPLTFVVEHFRQQNKKILLIGRQHMTKWPKLKQILSKTCNFFTHNVSEDDPYFITAAILSGSHTDFVSKDLLRGHRFQLQDEHLRQVFQRWQWQHQWKVFINRSGAPFLQAPLTVTPCAQKKGANWHLPFSREDTSSNAGLIRDGTPDWSSWLCLQAPVR